MSAATLTEAGPVEALWAQVRRGEIDVRQARQLIADGRLGNLFDAAYAGALSTACVALAMRGQWRAALDQHAVVMAAAAALPASEDALEIRRRVTLDAIDVAKGALQQLPDGRIYRQALADAKWLFDAATEHGWRSGPFGQLFFGIGTLHLDPYVAGRNAGNRAQYDESIRRWREALVQSLGNEYAFLFKEVEMPEPERALALADKYLRQALEMRTGAGRGASAKALLQTLLARSRLFGVAVDGAEVDGLGAQARELLDPDADTQRYAAVLGMLLQFGRSVDAAEIERVESAALPQIAHHATDGLGLDLAVEVLELHAQTDPRRALDFIVAVRPVLETAQGDRFSELLKRELGLLEALAPDGFAARFAADPDVPAELTWLEAQCAALDDAAAAGAYALLAHTALEHDREEDGSGVLQRLRERYPAFAQRHAGALQMLLLQLVNGFAVDAFDQQRWGDAVAGYGSTLHLALDAGWPHEAFAYLARIANVATTHDEQQVVAVTAVVLSQNALPLEAVGGDRATFALVELCRALLKSITAAGRSDSDTVGRLLQVMKGVRFAGELALGARYVADDDEDAVTLLSEIASLEPAASVETRGGIDEETLLTSYVHRGGALYGDGAAVRFENLQHRFDEHVDDLLLPAGGVDALPALAAEQLRSTVDATTVLLDLCIANDDRGASAAILAVTTAEDFNLYISADRSAPFKSVSFGDARGRTEMSPLALLVKAVRTGVQQYSGIGPVDRLAQADLNAQTRRYFGTFVDRLDELKRAGKTHLQIVPHGPLHFFPFHLLGIGGGTLADDWTVSYLPNIRLLTPPTGAPPQATVEAAVIGLGFAADPVLPPLTGTIDEANAIAKTFGVTPLLDAAATKTAVLDALAAARYVHVSTHGKHNAAAPAFQCLYLAAPEREERRLFAYEVLALDLRHVDVLTLSACETALGRFDYGDDPRGIPAAFLLAGVKALVGTLWDVAVEATEAFFPVFYARLHGGIPVRAAFRAAQLACREACPEYRDWGAFYFIDRGSGGGTAPEVDERRTSREEP